MWVCVDNLKGGESYETNFILDFSVNIATYNASFLQ